METGDGRQVWRAWLRGPFTKGLIFWVAMIGAFFGFAALLPRRFTSFYVFWVDSPMYHWLMPVSTKTVALYLSPLWTCALFGYIARHIFGSIESRQLLTKIIRWVIWGGFVTAFAFCWIFSVNALVWMDATLKTRIHGLDENALAAAHASMLFVAFSGTLWYWLVKRSMTCAPEYEKIIEAGKKGSRELFWLALSLMFAFTPLALSAAWPLVIGGGLLLPIAILGGRLNYERFVESETQVSED